MQTPPLQMWCDFLKDADCGMRWNEWKINFSMFAILMSRVMGENSYYQYINDNNSKNKNRKNLIHDFSFDSAHSAEILNFHFYLKRFFLKRLFWYAADAVRPVFVQPVFVQPILVHSFSSNPVFVHGLFSSNLFSSKH